MRWPASVWSQIRHVVQPADLNGEHARIACDEAVREAGEQILSGQVGRRGLVAPRAQPERSPAAGKQKTLEGHHLTRRQLSIQPGEDNRALLDDVRTATPGDVRNGYSLVVVFNGGHVAEPAVSSRSACVYAWKDALDASEPWTVETRSRHESLHASGESIASWPAVDLDHPAQESAVTDVGRVVQHVHAAHGFKRQVDGRRAAGWIGDIEAVKEQRRL